MNFVNSFSANSPEIVELLDDDEEEDNYQVVKNSDGEEVTIILSSATEMESDDDGVILIEKEEDKPSDTGKSSVQSTSNISPVSILASIPSNVKKNDEDVVVSTSSVEVVVEKSNKENFVEDKEILEEKSNDDDSNNDLEKKNEDLEEKENEDLEEKENEDLEEKSNGDNSNEILEDKSSSNDSTLSEHSNDATVSDTKLETISNESEEEDYKKLCLNLDHVIRLVHRRRTSKLNSCLIEKTKCMPDGYMEKLAKIRGAGFSNEKAVRCALELANYDVAMAVNILLEEQHSSQFKKRMESIMIIKDQTVPSLQLAMDLAVMSRSLGIVRGVLRQCHSYHSLIIKHQHRYSQIRTQFKLFGNIFWRLINRIGKRIKQRRDMRLSFRN